MSILRFVDLMTGDRAWIPAAFGLLLICGAADFLRGLAKSE